MIRRTAFCVVAFLAAGCGTTGVDPVPIASPLANTPGADPRATVMAFFDAIRRGNEQQALACWNNDTDQSVGNSEHRKYVEDVVVGFIRYSIAAYQLQQAMVKRFPLEMKISGERDELPDPAQIASAQSIRYVRLALVRWSDTEEDALPLFDAGRETKDWKLSMQQWYKTNRSAFGDSMLLSGILAQTAERTRQEVVDGKFLTLFDGRMAYLRHFSEIAETQGAENDVRERKYKTVEEARAANRRDEEEAFNRAKAKSAASTEKTPQSR